VRLDGLLRDHEALGDRPIRAPLGHQREHLTLALGQLIDARKRRRARDEPLGHRLVDHAAPSSDPLERLKENARVGDPVLEQVARSSRVSLRDAQCVTGVEVLREHEHADIREPGTDTLGRHQALICEGRRHPDVDQRDIR